MQMQSQIRLILFNQFWKQNLTQVETSEKHDSNLTVGETEKTDSKLLNYLHHFQLPHRSPQVSDAWPSCIQDNQVWPHWDPSPTKEDLQFTFVPPDPRAGELFQPLWLSALGLFGSRKDRMPEILMLKVGELCTARYGNINSS